MKCKFCEQEHEIEELCKITRRRFFFFSTVALVALTSTKLSILNKKHLTEAEIIAVELDRIMPSINSLFDNDDIFYRSIKCKQITLVSSRQIRVPLI